MKKLFQTYAKTIKSIVAEFKKTLESNKPITITAIKKNLVAKLKEKYINTAKDREEVKEQIKQQYMDTKLDEMKEAKKHIKIPKEAQQIIKKAKGENKEQLLITQKERKFIERKYTEFDTKMRRAENSLGRQLRNFFTKEDIKNTLKLNEYVKTNYTAVRQGTKYREQLINELIQKLENELYCKLKDKNGKPLKMSVEAYAKLNVNSMARGMLNQAKIRAGYETKNEYYVFSKHYWTCEICARYAEGRVYSGKINDKFPYLFDIPGFRDGYNTLHPNCQHLLSLYYPDTHTDEENEKRKKQSESHEDVRSEKDIKKYEENQERKLRARIKRLKEDRERLRNEKEKLYEDNGITNLHLEMTRDNQKFSNILKEAQQNNEHGSFVDFQSAEEVTGYQKYISDDNMATVAIKPDGDITCVVKDERSKYKSAVNDLILTARDNGGTKMDCYGIDLVNKYARCGYEPVARVKFNPEYAQGKPELLRDSPDVYFMKKTTEKTKKVIAKIKSKEYKVYTQKELDKLPTFEYDEAYEYRDKLLEEDKK